MGAYTYPAVIGAALLLFVVIAWAREMRHLKRLRRPRLLRLYVLRGATFLAGIYAVGVTIYTVHLQTRVASEALYASAGDAFVERELANADFRCLYDWYAHNDPVACRTAIISDPDRYTSTMLYIEEALFFLETAEEDRQVWGNRYIDDVGFWADDITVDPTGLFSYYLVSEYEGEFPAAIERAGLDIGIARACQNFRMVTAELEGLGARPQVDSPELC